MKLTLALLLITSPPPGRRSLSAGRLRSRSTRRRSRHPNSPEPTQHARPVTEFGSPRTAATPPSPGSRISSEHGTSHDRKVFSGKVQASSSFEQSGNTAPPDARNAEFSAKRSRHLPVHVPTVCSPQVAKGAEMRFWLGWRRRASRARRLLVTAL